LHSELIFDQTAVLGFPRYGFPAGATEQAIAGLERLVGHELPSSLKAMYRLHDGEVVRHGVDSPSLFFGLEFLSIAQSIEVRERFLAGLEADEEFPGLNEYHSLPPNTVQEVYYSRAWLPFAGLYTTDEIGLDFSPAAAGTVGQVILFRRDSDDRVRLAGSFDDFVQKLLDAYARRGMHPAFGRRLGEILDFDLMGLVGQ
jgi:cell wall assembly regulator SMI1